MCRRQFRKCVDTLGDIVDTFDSVSDLQKRPAVPTIPVQISPARPKASLTRLDISGGMNNTL